MACELTPTVNGVESSLYKDMLAITGDRSLTNLIYASYLTNGVDASIEAFLNKPENSGISKEKDKNTNQYNATAVLKFFNINKDTFSGNYLANVDLRTIAANKGFLDITTNAYISFTPEEALKKADAYNKNPEKPATIAVVMGHGTTANVAVKKLGVNSYKHKADIEFKLKAWEKIKETFRNNGMDISNIPVKATKKFNAFNADVAITYLKNLKAQDNQYMTEEDITTLFALAQGKMPSNFNNYLNDPQYGNIEKLARAAYLTYKPQYAEPGETVPNTTAQNALKGFIDKAKDILTNDINLDSLMSDIQNIADTLNADVDNDFTNKSRNKDIETTLNKLNDTLDVFKEDYNLTKDNIDSLSKAAAKAIVQTKRQIYFLKRKLNIEKEDKDRLYELTRSLEHYNKLFNSQKYYECIVKFLDDAVQQLGDVKSIISTAKNILEEHKDTKEEKFAQGIELARTIAYLNEIINVYDPIVSSILSKEFFVDSPIDSNFIESLNKTARKISEIFDQAKNVRNECENRAMTELCYSVIGEKESFNGVTIASYLNANTGRLKVSKLDYLYSIARCSNPVIASIGTILRDAQNTRNDKMISYRKRITEAHEKLMASGEKNTAFMYDINGDIANDYDWAEFYKEKRKARKELYNNGYRGAELAIELDKWVEANTEEIEVDPRVHRMERVPLIKKEYTDREGRIYRSFKDAFTDAQLEYYNTMMQIKAELESMIPEYARHYYMPPQITKKEFSHFFEDKNSTPRDIAKGFIQWAKSKIQDLYKIREDNTEYAENGQVNGEFFVEATGNYDDTESKEIPIFFTNRLKNTEDLMKNFSTAINMFAGTAINYQCMSKVRDAVETMSVVVNKRGDTDATNKEGTTKKDFVDTGISNITNSIYKTFHDKDAMPLLIGAIDSAMYGIKRQGNNKLHQFYDILLSLNSKLALKFNFIGGLVNEMNGELQCLIEAGGGEFYNMKDLTVAHKKIWGKEGFAGVLKDMMINGKTSKAYLLSELLDPKSSSFTDLVGKNYDNNVLMKLLDHKLGLDGLPFYEIGEYIIHQLSMYSILNNIKVNYTDKDGKLHENASLDDAIDVTVDSNGTHHLELNPSAVFANGEAIPSNYLTDVIKPRIQYCNQTCHGAMATEDKGVFTQYCIGRLVMSFRQWMIEVYSKRFRGDYFDNNLKQVRRGYYNDLLRLIVTPEYYEKQKNVGETQQYGNIVLYYADWVKNLFNGMWRLNRMYNLYKNSDLMDTQQKANVKRALTELSLLVLLELTSRWMYSDPKDIPKDDFWTRFSLLILKRLTSEFESLTPTPVMLSSMMTLANSPVPVTSRVNNFMYSVYGLGDMYDSYQYGINKGKNKYLHLMSMAFLPGYKDYMMYEKLEKGDNNMYKIFDAFKAR